MNCKELAYMLADYFDGSMDLRLREELDSHLAMCEPCLSFTKTYRVTCDKTRELRKDIEYQIPPDVRSRLENFVRSAALKFPEMVREYRDQVDRERVEKVTELIRAAIAGKLSSITSLLVETHCAICPDCKEYFDGLLKAGKPLPGMPPTAIHSHVTRLMESLPPGEEFFLA
ncbi:MAG TPA: zf-HC2 domain-containing protein [Candidatus Deferrimicrobiaceae bacterium]